MGRERTRSQDLIELSKAVAKWRTEGGGGRGTRIPEELWSEAVRVAHVDGVWLTARTVRFNYEGLRRRISRAEGSEGIGPGLGASEIEPMKPARANGRSRAKRREAPTPPGKGRAARRQPNAFVELSAAQVLGVSEATATGTVVEVEDKAGTRMIVRLAKEAPVDVAQLVSAFRRGGA